MNPSPPATTTATGNTETNQPKEVKRLSLSHVQESTSQVIGTMAQTMPVATSRRDKKATPQASARAGPTAGTTTPGPGSKVVVIKDSSFKRAIISNSNVHNFAGVDYRSADAVSIDASSYEGAMISNGSNVSNFAGARF